MKTQAVSNQNFNGNIYFVEKTGQKSNNALREHFIKKLGTQRMEKINSLIKEKPYDIFISRSEIYPGFYNIDADTSFVQALRNRPQKGYTEKVSDSGISWLPYGIRDVIESYEEFMARTQAETEELTKKYVLKPYKTNKKERIKK